MPSANDSSPVLLGRIARGDSTALALAYDQFGRAAYAVALRLLASPDEAEEAVQDAFKALWTHAGELVHRDSNLMAWLVTATRRRAIDSLRKRRRRIPGAAQLNEAQADRVGSVPGEGPTAGDELEQREQAERVRKALGSLPVEQAEVVRLAFFSGQTHQEIAERLVLPLGTVKSRLRYALVKLQGMMGDVAHE